MNFADLVKNARPTTLEAVLAAREERASRQRALLERHGGALVSFTLNLPGEYKAYPLARDAFDEGMAVMARQLTRARAAVAERLEHAADTGFEGYFAVAAEPADVKAMTLAVEGGHPLGRLFDFDVMGADGVPLRGADAGRGERTCLACGKPVWECSRSRAHPAAELAARAAALVKEFFDGRHADRIASAATRALLYEVNVTPKPGLVDRNNNGSHRDMDSFTFIDGAAALTPHFRRMALIGTEFAGEASELLPRLRFSGQAAEEDMFAATDGVNTHKGLIFSLGIFCAAAGFIRSKGVPATVGNILRVCGDIAAGALGELDRPNPSGPETHGEAAYLRYGLSGARGEAAAGYPHVGRHGYPVFVRMREAGCSVNDAGAIALLHLIARVPDTNMATRSDLATLRSVQDELRAFLDRVDEPGRILDFAAELDKRFIERNLSPGGSADLLALVLFLSFVASK